jgi:hypothetical protein
MLPPFSNRCESPTSSYAKARWGILELDHQRETSWSRFILEGELAFRLLFLVELLFELLFESDIHTRRVKMRESNLNRVEEHDIKWELDGGGYHTHECATLFEGRLYTNPRELNLAKLRARAKRMGRLAALVGPILFLWGRN